MDHRVLRRHLVEAPSLSMAKLSSPSRWWCILATTSQTLTMTALPGCLVRPSLRSIALTCIENCWRCLDIDELGKVRNTIHYRVLPLDVVVHDANFMEVLKHPLMSRCTFSMQYSSYPCKELGPTLQKPLGYLNITYTPEEAYTRDWIIMSENVTRQIQNCNKHRGRCYYQRIEIKAYVWSFSSKTRHTCTEGMQFKLALLDQDDLAWSQDEHSYYWIPESARKSQHHRWSNQLISCASQPQPQLIILAARILENHIRQISATSNALDLVEN